MNWLYSHSTLQIEPTRKCNLDCKICLRKNLNETSTLLSLNNFKRILDSYNFQHVALHGWGEPLLNPELLQMVKYADSKGISTELTTNATLLKTNIERIFDSGLDVIVFGIHKKENLPVVMPQIKWFIAQRNKRKLKKPKTYFDIVIYMGNQNQIMDLVEAAAELNIDAVVLHRVFYNYRTEPEVGYISIQEEKDLFTGVNNMARKLKLKVHLPPQPSIPCRAVKYSIFVTSEGKVTPCPYLTEFYMGNAINGGVKEVIYINKYIKFIKNMGKHPICTECPLGSVNGGFYA